MSDLSKLPQAAPTCYPAGVTDQHAKDAFELRFGTATKQAVVTGSVTHATNNDESLYLDKSGTYTKCLLQKDYGVVDPNAFKHFRQALGSADGSVVGTANFEVAGLLGGPRKLNGPLAAFSFPLIGADSQAFGDTLVPPAPALASPEYATELVELYWASLLRDVPFTEFETNATAIAAANELNMLGATYAGPKDSSGHVTPRLLFRGGFTVPASGGHPKKTYFAGEDKGPYLSQFCIVPTNLVAQKMDQMMQTFPAGIDYMTDLASWQNVQNGANPPPIQPASQRRFLHNGRGLAAFTHQDELYQAYLTAYLVLNTMGIGPNKSSPYLNLNNQQPFGTFGGPDIVSMLAAVAGAAINSVWYQKWIVHLRHRPESGGGIVQLMQTGLGSSIQGHVDSIVLNSSAVHLSHLRHGSYLLSQAFPEGSPAHPSYPTGHGTVAGACVTVLKFFYDGTAPIPRPLVPSRDGLSLEPYNGTDAGQMTVNGELAKLAHNISFGHGIHAGIHWRSDTDSSILLGEAVALGFLQDHAFTYKENIAVSLTKMDGSTVVIKNY